MYSLKENNRDVHFHNYILVPSIIVWLELLKMKDIKERKQRNQYFS